MIEEQILGLHPIKIGIEGVFQIQFRDSSGHPWEKTLITLMLANARAARRCFACGKTCFAAALELQNRYLL